MRMASDPLLFENGPSRQLAKGWRGQDHVNVGDVVTIEAAWPRMVPSILATEGNALCGRAHGCFWQRCRQRRQELIRG